MATLELYDKHNMVAYLIKTEGSEDFQEIIDFLSGSHISYALTESLILYMSLIDKFWQTAVLSTTEEGVQAITATINGRETIITEASLRRHFKLEDSTGLPSLPNEEIFEQLTNMGYAITSDSLTFFKGYFSPQWKFFIHTILHCMSSKKTVWDQFSSNIATAIICLATNRTFNFSKFIFEAMGEAPSTSPLRISYSPSLSPEPSPSPDHTTTSAPSTSQPQPSQPSPDAEETVPTPHESPLHAVHSHRSDEGRLQQTDLTDLVTKLSDRIVVLEKDLQQTKKTYSAAFTKLILRVKKLEKQVKSGKARRRARIVLSEDEDAPEDSSKQERKISDIDEDPNISLVQDERVTCVQDADTEIQEKVSDETELVLQEEIPTKLVEDQCSGEKSEKEVTTPTNFQTYIRQRRGVSTSSGGDSTASRQVSTADIGTVSEVDAATAKAKDKGKAIMTEPEPEKKTKLKERQERAGLEAAIKLQEQLEEEEKQRLARDAKIAKRLYEEINVGLKPVSVAQARKNMITFLKNQGGYKVKSFKKMSYDEIRPIFEKVWDQVHLFVPMDTGDKEKKSVAEQEESAKEEDVKPEQIVKEVCKKSGGKRRKSLAKKRARETEDEETSKKQNSAPSSSSISSSTSIFHTLRQESVKRSRSDNTGTNEFGRYTGTDWIISMEQKEFNNFDILSLWKGRQSQFPVLSIMARDLLSVQAFTVASESAFSLSGRVLSIRRTRLIPASFEMCICLKGHLDAQERIQHTSNIEDNCLEIEHQLCKVEAEVGYVISIADEEIVLDDQAMSGSGSGDSE
ncbi:zinc finger BED domain-containing protein RICESLEEPER 2 [Tanacetum coccineum]